MSLRYTWGSYGWYQDIEEFYNSLTDKAKEKFELLYKQNQDGELDDDDFIDSVLEDEEKDLPEDEGLVYVFDDRDYSDGFTVIKVVRCR